jgi:hypothetical protein
MNSNIFVKLNKKKYNPDIESKLNELENHRTTTKFNLSKTIYNPITGVIPDKLNSQKDLILQKDNQKVDIKSLVLVKENERLQQNESFKPVKTKVINSPNTNIIQNLNNQSINNDYIKTYNDLKNDKQPKINNQNNYDNILVGLKDLGIIK